MAPSGGHFIDQTKISFLHSIVHQAEDKREQDSAIRMKKQKVILWTTLALIRGQKLKLTFLDLTSLKHILRLKRKPLTEIEVLLIHLNLRKLTQVIDLDLGLLQIHYAMEMKTN